MKNRDKKDKHGEIYTSKTPYNITENLRFINLFFWIKEIFF